MERDGAAASEDEGPISPSKQRALRAAHADLDEETGFIVGTWGGVAPSLWSSFWYRHEEEAKEKEG